MVILGGVQQLNKSDLPVWAPGELENELNFIFVY